MSYDHKMGGTTSGPTAPVAGGGGGSTSNNPASDGADLSTTCTFTDGGDPAGITATGWVVYPQGSDETDPTAQTFNAPINAPFTVTGLSPSTNYCAKPFATNSIGTTYCAEVCFTTLAGKNLCDYFYNYADGFGTNEFDMVNGGNVTTNSTLGSIANANDAIDLNGKLYIVTDSYEVAERDPNTFLDNWTVSFNGVSGIGFGSQNNSIETDGTLLYVAQQSNSGVQLFSINPTTQAVNYIGIPSASVGTAYSMKYCAGFLFLVDSVIGNIVKVNPATGAIVGTYTNTTGGFFFGNTNVIACDGTHLYYPVGSQIIKIRISSMTQVGSGYVTSGYPQEAAGNIYVTGTGNTITLLDTATMTASASNTAYMNNITGIAENCNGDVVAGQTVFNPGLTTATNLPGPLPPATSGIGQSYPIFILG